MGESWGSRAFCAVVLFLARAILSCVFPRKVQGREYLHTESAKIIVGNHLSGYDPILLGMELWPTKLYIMGKAELFRNKIGAWMLYALGAFPVGRGKADVASMRNAIRCLDGNAALVIFPEGTRNKKNPEVFLPFLSGAAFVALRAKKPVVPVYFANLKGYRFFRRVEFRAGPPIFMDDLYAQPKITDEHMKEFMERVKDAILKLKENN